MRSSSFAALLFVATACGGPHPSLVPTPPQELLSSFQPGAERGAVKFTFMTIDDQFDPTFNEVLGLNNEAKLVGFYGSGTPGHPNRGYVVFRPYQQNNFKTENYPGAAETQVTCVNNKKTSAGFYVESNGDTFGFAYIKGIWSSYENPRARTHSPEVTELLGLNDSQIAVGFYEDGAGKDHAFTVNFPTGVFHDFTPPGASEAVATGITGAGDIVGYLKKGSHWIGFFLRQGKYIELSFPRATQTKFLGVTVHDQIVGSYVGRTGVTHGLLLLNPRFKKSTTWQTIDEPNAVGTTVATGINLHDEITGYYVDSAGKTNGFFGVPSSLRRADGGGSP